jgi:hypothetical protein
MYLFLLKKLSIFELKIMENKTGKLVHGERSVVVCGNTGYSAKT